MGISYTCGSLAEGMVDRSVKVTIVTPRARWLPQSVEVIEILPKWAQYVPYRWVRGIARSKIEHVFLCYMDQLQSQKVAAYLWPNATIETVSELKKRNVTIFREQFNCPTATAKVILDQAYERLGVMPQHGITAEIVNEEARLLEKVDYIFCPNPAVEASLLENGVPASKLLKTSYGWDPARFARSKPLYPKCEGLTAVFVGAICVRKGAHLLLEYWARSGIKGRLILAGEMEPTIKKKCANLLARKDVIVFDYYRNIGALYRSADCFLFPSLEEGGPQVIYEACGCSLPIATTGMAAGRIVRNNCEGFVIDPYDADGWVAAIRALAQDVKLRQRMANAAIERSKSFVWPAVASQRRRQILQCMGKISDAGNSEG